MIGRPSPPCVGQHTKCRAPPHGHCAHAPEVVSNPRLFPFIPAHRPARVVMHEHKGMVSRLSGSSDRASERDARPDDPVEPDTRAHRGPTSNGAREETRPRRPGATCPRCAEATWEIYVMCRMLGPDERRVCDRCLPRRLAEGMRVSGSDDVLLACRDCHGHARPSHVVSPVASPTAVRCCGRCKRELRDAGWRAAVVTTWVP
jgi:hypothetical protein